MTRPLENHALAREHSTHPTLAGRVRCFSARVDDASCVPHTLLPDGCVDVIFEIGSGDVVGHAIGATTAPNVVARPPGTRVLGITFLPGEARAFFDFPLHVLRDRVVDVRDAWGVDAERLLDELRALGSDEARVGCIDEHLRRRASRSPETSRQARIAVERLRRHRGAIAMRALCAELGASERRLERVFVEQIGLPPKTLARIVRIEAALDRLSTTTAPSLAALAGELGFADQAHLSHEFRRMTGISPGAWLRTRRSSVSYKPPT